MSIDFQSNKRLARNTIVLCLRQLLVLSLGLYTSRLTLSILGETDYGIYAAVGGITSLLTILTTSLTSGTQRFITIALGRGDSEKLNRVYVTSINLHVALSILLVIVGEFVGSWFILNKMNIPTERVQVAFLVFQITLFNSVLSLINIPNNAEIIAHEDMGTWAWITILDTVLKLCSVVGLTYISWDKLLIYAIALFIIQFLQRTICLCYCKYKYEEVRYSFLWDKELVKSMLHVSGWTGLSNLSIAGFVQGTSILLNLFFGPIVNAAYSVAFQAYSGIRTFCSSFQLASNPQIVKLYSVGDLQGMNSLVCSICKLSFFILFVFSLPFLVHADIILNLWLGKVPEHAVGFFVLLLFYAYADVLAYPLDISAQATGNVKTYSITISVLIFMILPLAYVAFYYQTIPESIYLIAIMISVISICVRLVFLHKIVGLDLKYYFKNVVLRIMSVLLVSAIPSVILSSYEDSSIVKMFIVSLLIIGWTLVVMYAIGLSQKEKEFARNMIFKFINKVHL